ncbi:MAG: hypothetical protein PVI20_04140 [Desulfobacteraceae bacterium]
MSKKGMDKSIFKSGKELFSPTAWPTWVSRILAAAVGLILIGASVLKAIDVDLFVEQLGDYGIISHHTVLVLGAWGLICLEFGLGVALLIYYRPKISLPLAGMLFLVFLGGTGWMWLSGTTEECGCFGDVIKHTPQQAVVHDLIFLAATGLAWMGSLHGKTAQSRVKFLTVVVACLVGLLLPVAFGFSVSKITQPPPKAAETPLEELEMDPKANMK